MTLRSRIAPFLALAALAAFVAPAARAGDAPAGPPAATPAAAEAPAKPAADEAPAIDEMPAPTKTVSPSYPESARQRKQEGTVYVQAHVTKTGKVGKVRILPGRGVAADLDKAALDAVRQWEFKPARVKGEAKAAWVVIPIAFRLH